ncbi:MAG: enoyl-CoA hydratase/isomerase family protein [Terriglobia bacterium]
MPDETSSNFNPIDPERPPNKGFEFIRWDDSGNVAHLTLCRPPQNVLNFQMLQEILAAIESLHSRAEVRLVVLDAGPECDGYFSMGVEAIGYRSNMVFQMMEAFHDVFRAIHEVGKPVLAVVDGLASAGGSELAAFCDLAIATERARFLQPEIKLGVFPPLGAIVYPRVIGPKRALEMLLTGESIGAQEALQMGLVNRVVPRAQLAETLRVFVQRIADQSAPVVSMLKQVVFEGTWRTFDDAFRKSRDIYLNQLFELEDSQEGLRAMAEKRKPVWKNK